MVYDHLVYSHYQSTCFVWMIIGEFILILINRLGLKGLRVARTPIVN